MDSPDLSKVSLEELTRLPDWMVPPSRKEELAEYRRCLRRAEVKKADQASKDLLRKDRFVDPRGFVPQKGSLSRSHTSGGSSAAPSSTVESSDVRYGSRGGRYTEETTKEGRRYRRYF